MNYELKTGLEDSRVMISEPPNNPMENRVRLAEIMFDEFNVKSLYFANSPSLSLFASARTTGTVVDTGHGVTQAVPIYEGYTIPHAVMTMELSGQHLTKYLHEMIVAKGSHIKVEEELMPFDLDAARFIKEGNACYCALDFDSEMK